jgi:hypothetical protein
MGTVEADINLGDGFDAFFDEVWGERMWRKEFAAPPLFLGIKRLEGEFVQH